MAGSDRLLNLQALRAFAALLVVYVHSGDLLYRVPGYSLHAIGHGGVDLFFVISGFVMVLTTAEKDISPGLFLWRRFTRIAPLYWLVTLFVFGLASVAPAAFKSTQANPLELLKSLAFFPYLKDSGLVSPIVFVGWTLNLEMAFYVLLALTMVANRRWSYWLTVVALAAISTIGLARPEDPIARFYTTTMLAEFGAGMLLALGWMQLPTTPTRPMLWAAIALLVLGLPALMASPSMHDLPLRFIIAGIPSILIVAGATALDRWGRGWRNLGVQLLGDSSYSMYLTHFFFTGAAFAVAKKFGMTGAAVLPVFAASLFAVVIASVLVHRYIERPLTRLVSGIRHKAPRPLPVMP